MIYIILTDYIFNMFNIFKKKCEHDYWIRYIYYEKWIFNISVICEKCNNIKYQKYKSAYYKLDESILQDTAFNFWCEYIKKYKENKNKYLTNLK